jgi:hypothetical protein
MMGVLWKGYWLNAGGRTSVPNAESASPLVSEGWGQYR